MQTLNWVLDQAVKKGFYRDTKEGGHEGYIRFIDFGTNYCMAEHYQMDGVLISRGRSVWINTSPERERYELVPENQLPPFLREKLSAQSQPKLTESPEDDIVNREFADYVGDILRSDDSQLLPTIKPKQKQNSNEQSETPFCDQCGYKTVRNGTIYKCMNCGNSVNCS